MEEEGHPYRQRAGIWAEKLHKQTLLVLSLLTAPSPNSCFISGCAGSSLLCGLSLAAVSGGYSLGAVSGGFSLRWLLLVQSTGSRVRGLQQLQLAGSSAQPQKAP